MSRITGIGGVFLKLNTETKELLKWYKEVLELDVTDYGINFLVPNKFTLITFDRSEDNEAILNFTVDNLEQYLEKLRVKGVHIYKEIKIYEYGKFAQIKDIVGNRIELWEPFEKEYIDMVKKEVNEFSEK